MMVDKARKLNEWGIAYKKLMLVREPIPENKVNACNEYSIDMMIDDDERNIMAIHGSGIGTVCLKYVV